MAKIILRMRRLFSFAGVLILTGSLITSCNNQAPMDPAAVQAKVDSLAAGRIKDATAKATTDCETRMATEVKAMTDSIVNAAKAVNAPK